MWTLDFMTQLGATLLIWAMMFVLVIVATIGFDEISKRMCGDSMFFVVRRAYFRMKKALSRAQRDIDKSEWSGK
jgi:hypothetical protein